VATHPETFVGLGWEKDGTPVIAFGPGIDTKVWDGQLKAAAGRLAYRTRTCTHSQAELEDLATELASRTWSPRAHSISFDIDVDPATCSVRLTSDLLLPSDIRALTAQYGSLVTIDTKDGHPVRLGASP